MAFIPPDNPRFSVIIATKDRRDDLIPCLNSLKQQSLLPCQIIIVDATRQCGDEAHVYQVAAEPIPVVYVRARRAGLPSQRNQGIGLLSDDTQYVIFVDDDVIVEPSYCGELIRMLESNSEIAGVSGWIVNPLEAPGERWFRWLLRLFLIYGRVPGQMLPSGFNNPLFVARPNQPYQTECLEGCNMGYRLATIRDLRFDSTYERFAGYAYAEDVDFSYAVSKRGQLWVTPHARMLHKVSPANRLNDFRFGMCQVTNRALFVTKHWGDRYHFSCFLWSMLGIMVLNIGMLAAGRSPKRLLGNIVGLVLVLTGQLRSQPQP